MTGHAFPLDSGSVESRRVIVKVTLTRLCLTLDPVSASVSGSSRRTYSMPVRVPRAARKSSQAARAVHDPLRSRYPPRAGGWSHPHRPDAEPGDLAGIGFNRLPAWHDLHGFRAQPPLVHRPTSTP